MTKPIKLACQCGNDDITKMVAWTEECRNFKILKTKGPNFVAAQKEMACDIQASGIFCFDCGQNIDGATVEWEDEQ